MFAEFKTNALEEKLVSLLQTSGKIYNGIIYEVTLRNGFLPKHSVEIFNSLQSDGRIEVLSDTGEKVRKGAFYISYDNYKTTPKKVYFKIK